MFHLATVLERVNDPQTGAYGINVVFRDGVQTSYSPDALGTYVRVLQDRAHPLHGSSQGLPRPGEFGLVAELHGGFFVWIGSLPTRDANQIDPEAGLVASREDCGILRQVRADGRCQWNHPSGLRVTVSPTGEALPELQRKGDGIPPPEAAREPHAVEVEFGSGLKIRVSPEGAVTISKAASLTLQIDGGMDASAGGNASLTAAKIILDGPVECTQDVVVKGTMTGGAVKTQAGIDVDLHKHLCSSPGTPSGKAIP